MIEQGADILFHTAYERSRDLLGWATLNSR